MAFVAASAASNVCSPQDVIKLGMAIYTLYKDYKGNKEACKNLAEEVDKVTNLIKAIENTPALKYSIVNEALSGIQQTLTEIQMRIEGFIAKSKAKKIFRSEKYKNRFSDLHQSLKDDETFLTTALATKIALDNVSGLSSDSAIDCTDPGLTEELEFHARNVKLSEKYQAEAKDDAAKEKYLNAEMKKYLENKIAEQKEEAKKKKQEHQSSLKRFFGETKDDLQEMKKSLEDVRNDMEFNQEDLKSFEAALHDIKSFLEDSYKKSSVEITSIEIKKDINDLNSEINGLIDSLSHDLSTQLNKISNQVEEVSGRISNVDNSIKQVDRKVGDLNDNVQKAVEFMGNAAGLVSDLDKKLAEQKELELQRREQEAKEKEQKKIEKERRRQEEEEKKRKNDEEKQKQIQVFFLNRLQSFAEKLKLPSSASQVPIGEDWYQKGYEAEAAAVTAKKNHNDEATKKYQEAFEAYMTAKNLGYLKGFTNLGMCFYRGVGVTKDEAKGKDLIQQGAEKGHGRAMYFLAKILKQEEDFAGAKDWAQKALKSDFISAITDPEQRKKSMGELEQIIQDCTSVLQNSGFRLRPDA